jgi:diketogulonate reductase-like aldo/keto reductase
VPGQGRCGADQPRFDDGRLFARVKDQALPGWAAEAGIGSWAQLFLKFAISHPAVTTVIPATGRPDRQLDQLKAGHEPAHPGAATGADQQFA